MSSQSLLVYDVLEQFYEANAELVSGQDTELSGSETWSIKHRRLLGGKSEGVDLIELNNGPLSVTIVPTRGMGIWRGAFNQIPLGWDSPVKQIVNPAFVELNDRGGLGWLSGFNEWFCRCGLAFNGPPGEDTNGTPLTLHGRIANTPAHRVEMEVDSTDNGLLAVTGVVDETSLFGSCLRLTTRIETEAGSNRLRIFDTITNLGSQAAELELLYHTNIGRPFLEPGAKICVPALEVIPQTPHAAEAANRWETYEAPQSGFAEQVYFFKLASTAERETEVLLKNEAGDRGISLGFSLDQLPNFIVWKNTGAEEDGYVTGLEPSTNLPNFKSFERDNGRVITLEPGANYQSRVDIGVYDTSATVTEAQARVENLQNGQTPLVHSTPQSGMSPAGG